MERSIFDVLPKDLVFEIFTALPAEDVSKMVSTCKAAAAAFTTDKMWFYVWTVRHRSYAHALVAAVARRDPEGLRRLLSMAPKEFDVNGPLCGGEIYTATLLHYAVAEGHVPTIDELLQTPGFDVNHCNGLHAAVDFGKKHSLGALLCCPAIDPNSCGDRGMTALHLACALNSPDSVALLTHHPLTNVNAVTVGMGDMPLHTAVHSAQIINMLLQHPRVDVNARNKYGETALHEAVRLPSVPVVHALLSDPRVDVNARDVRGNTPLHFAAGRLGANEAAMAAVAQLLIRAQGVDVNAQDTAGMTPLHKAAMAYQGVVAQVLVQAPGVDVGVVDGSGMTALELSIAMGSRTVRAALE